ncbi:GAP family protein [Aeromicrobium tamlense]|uniref:GAP family protein n=1 Tax=Aeromicrobium tamlense TaxID=375541 RepID=A0A8I0KJ59_9ACTN|nr:GAP family protein [Aeromicrobium tamlense]MBD1270742.1 GAP family protein [Aeromicrobium tamlense]MBD1271126.1 GAP family protein [Aeromicrobium tamlense]NYI38134.1 hypothetical protein [Aeromicrobium tamlense]
MNDVVGEVLPLAMGVAISPLPVIAAILMLLSPRARATSLGFLAGWLSGIIVAAGTFVLAASVLPGQDSTGSAPVAGTIKIALGALMLVLAARQWRSRPVPGEDARLPKWMSAIDAMNAVRAAGLGFLLAAVNPKNLLMAAGAGVTIGSADLSAGGSVMTVVIFTLLAGCSVALPVVVALGAGQAVEGPLARLRAGLVVHNAAVMTVVLAVIGVALVGQGIGSW